MNALFPVIAAILQSVSFTLDKKILSMRRVGFRMYTGVSMPLVFVITSIIYILFQPPITSELFSGHLLLFLIISVVGSAITNIFFYRALDGDSLGEIEIISLVNAIPVLIVTSILFADERNFLILIPALVASGAVIWAHWQRHHFRIVRGTRFFLLWYVMYTPVSAILSKELLFVWNPIALELIRSGALALIFITLFWQQAKRVPWSVFLFLLATNTLTSISWILYYYGYQRIGVVHTILLFSLQPLLVYTASLLYLKEKPHRKKIIAFGIVLASITVAQFLAG